MIADCFLLLRPSNFPHVFDVLIRVRCDVVKSSAPSPARPHFWIEAIVLISRGAIVLGGAEVATQWRQPLRQTVDIDLSAWALPKYALFPLARGWIAYFFSLLFTLVVASWAYYSTRARAIILPSLDVLQSVPLLGFLPSLVLALVALFPRSNAGLELACVLMIFTGQVWNMTFSFSHPAQLGPLRGID